MSESATMKVWLQGEEIERPVSHFETKLRKRFGGCDEVQTVPIPQLQPGERIENRKYKILIIPNQERLRA